MREALQKAIETVENTVGAPVIVEHKFFDLSALRSLCVDRSYYEEGTGEEYEQMFSRILANKYECDITLLYQTAKDIVLHSSYIMTRYGCTLPEAIESVMFEINREAVNTTYSIE